MTTPTAAERAYDLIYRALVLGEPCEAELTEIYKKADGFDWLKESTLTIQRFDDDCGFNHEAGGDLLAEINKSKGRV